MPDIDNDWGLPSDVLARPITLASGRNREDKNFRNDTRPLRQWLDYLVEFGVGPKDGPCILQGSLAQGGRRLATNMADCSLMLVDLDTGESMDAVIEKLQKFGCFAYVWTTHSHMKDETEVSQDQLIKWYTKQGRAFDYSENEVVRAAHAWLSEEKRYHPDILEAPAYGGIKQTQSGAVYVIKHKPMPKMRVLFVLDEPFVFVTGTTTQKERIDGWKSAYARVCDALGVAYDRACVDPSRLQYTPRIATASSPNESVIVDGKLLSLGDVPSITIPPKGVGDRRVEDRFSDPAALTHLAGNNRREGAAGTDRVFKTPGLLQFAKDCVDFDAVAWLNDVAPDDVRPGNTTKEGVHWTCPNEDNHTKISPEDTAFAVFMSEDGWGMHCRHEGCIAASGEDRLWYLDELCQKYGIAHASELYAYSDAGKAVKEREAESVALSTDDDGLGARIKSITAASTTQEIELVLAALARHREPLFVEAAIRQMAKASGGVYTAPILKRRMKDFKKKGEMEAASAENNSEVDEFGIPKPPEDLKDAHTIWREWGAKKVMAAVKRRITVMNEDEPFVFTRADGSSARLIETNDMHGTALRIEKLSVPQWAAMLNDKLHFRRIDRDTERAMDSFCEPQIASDMCFEQKPEWPLLRGVARVPIFAKDGSLRTQKGYDDDLCVYLDPQEDWLPVPAVVTPEDVEIAKGYLLELVRDVPFSDMFEGDEALPIYTKEIGEDGWPVTNMARGTSSRLHYFSAIIQTFIRYMIDGACPAYHIDKHDHGEGGTLLANLLSIIIEGIDATATALPVRDEEVNKTITTALVEGAPILLFDNIPAGKVSSPEIAMALTAGQWKARLLGTNINAFVPIMNVWVFVGVNLTFHKELVRRNIPLKINSKTPNPALRKGSLFKHNPGERFARENRKELVWSCHVLVRNWFQCGQPVDADVNEVNSFTEWSRVMGGIFHAAGWSGAFLKTLPEYYRSHNDDGMQSIGVVQKLYDRYGTQPFTASDAVVSLKNPMGELEDVPVTAHSEHGLTIALGRWLRKDLMGKTFSLTNVSGGAVDVSLLSSNNGSGQKYHFHNVNAKN